MTSPVALFVFNRPEPTARVFATIAAARPTRLLVVADGPRPDHPEDQDACARTRAVLDRIDWPCELTRNFSDTNLGVTERVVSGLDWVFSEVPEAIILEDDCLPDPSFFPFCDELLDRHREDDRVHLVRGTAVPGAADHIESSYYFSRFCNIWGWASWARAWRHNDVEMKDWSEHRDTGWLEQVLPDPAMAAAMRRHFDHAQQTQRSWDFQWTYACWRRDALAACPATNLVSNIGFGPGATDQLDPEAPLAKLPTSPMAFPLRHPGRVEPDDRADRAEWEVFAGSADPGSVLGRIRRSLQRRTR